MKVKAATKIYYLLQWDAVHGKGNTLEGWIYDSYYHVLNDDCSEMLMPQHSVNPKFHDSYLNPNDYRDVYKVVGFERSEYCGAVLINALAIFDRTVHKDTGELASFGPDRWIEAERDHARKFRGPHYAAPDVF